mmetsp:Transcript_28525/g.40868  ORF Transcript_28525/g.40868 Transcript_28525/m.40868 type:complete len:141 (-) Transcript_28525:2356-2778(-)
MNNQHQKKQTQNLAENMTLTQGDKVLVVGTGATRNKVGYIIEITACHYVLYFMDESSARVWKQNVRLLNGDNQTEKAKVEQSIARAHMRDDWHTENLQSQLSRAIAKQQRTADEIANLVHQLTGVTVESPATRRNQNKKG